MKITTTIKKESTKEISHLFIDKRNKNRFYISSLIYILFLLISIINKIIILVPVFIVLILISAFVLYLNKKAREEVMDKVFDKLYPNGEYTLTLKLKKDEISFKNSHFSDEINVNYEDIKEIKETTNYILLFLNNKTHFILPKEDFDFNKFIEKLNKKIGKVK